MHLPWALEQTESLAEWAYDPASQPGSLQRTGLSGDAATRTGLPQALAGGRLSDLEIKEQEVNNPFKVTSPLSGFEAGLILNTFSSRCEQNSWLQEFLLNSSHVPPPTHRCLYPRWQSCVFPEHWLSVSIQEAPEAALPNDRGSPVP